MVKLQRRSSLVCGVGCVGLVVILLIGGGEEGLSYGVKILKLNSSRSLSVKPFGLAHRFNNIYRYHGHSVQGCRDICLV